MNLFTNLSPEEGMFVVNDKQILIVEMTNSEIRQAVDDISNKVVDTDGNDDEYITVLLNELDSR